MTSPQAQTAPQPAAPVWTVGVPLPGSHIPAAPMPVTSYELVLLRVLAAEEEPPGMLTLLDCVNPCCSDMDLKGPWETRQAKLLDAFSQLRSKGLIEELPRPEDPDGNRYVRTPLGRAIVGH